MEYSLLKLQIAHYIKQACSLIWVKGLFAFVYAILIPHQYILQGFALLFILDFITGVWVAIKCRNVSSAGMRRGVAKLIIYFMAILTVSVAERVTVGTQFMTSTAIGLLVFTEAVSVIENLMVLGLPMPVVGVLIRLIQSKAKASGLNLGSIDDGKSIAAAKDLVDILNESIPTLRCGRIHTCMHIWVSRWHGFVTTVNAATLSGSQALAWERVRNLCNQVIRDSRYDMVRAGIPENDLAVFLEHWNSALVAGLFSVCKEACLRSTGSAEDRATAIHNAVAMMVYRLLKEVRVIDLAATSEDSDLIQANANRLDSMTPSGAHRAIKGREESSGKMPGTEMPIPIKTCASFPGIDVARRVPSLQRDDCEKSHSCVNPDCPLKPKV